MDVFTSLASAKHFNLCTNKCGFFFIAYRTIAELFFILLQLKSFSAMKRYNKEPFSHSFFFKLASNYLRALIKSNLHVVFFPSHRNKFPFCLISSSILKTNETLNLWSTHMQLYIQTNDQVP